MKKIFAIAALLTFSILGGTARAERARIKLAEYEAEMRVFKGA